MKFSLFNQELIEKLKKFNLKSLNRKSYEILLLTNNIYENVAAYSLPITQTYGQHKIQLIKAIKKTNSFAFRNSLENYRKDVQTINQYKQRRVLQAKIIQIIEDLPEEPISNPLHARRWWLRNRKTFHYTSEELVAITRDIFPVVENFYSLAKVEFKQYEKEMSWDIKKQVKNYLNQLKEDLEYEKQLILEGMLTRLEIASKRKSLEEDNILQYIVEEINRQKPETNLLSEKTQGLKPLYFHYFHGYLLKNVNKKQLERMKRLSWLNKTNNYDVQTIDDQFVIIPRQMKGFNIPMRTQTLFPFLFRWLNFKGEFFKNHFYLLVKIKMLDEDDYFASKPLSEMLNGNDWQQLLDLEREVTLQKKTLTTGWPRFLVKLFQPEKQKFLHEWQCFSEEILLKVLIQKINYASLLAEQLHTRVIFNLDKEVLALKANKTFLTNIISDIDKMSNTLSRQKNAQWQNARNIFIQVIDSKSASRQMIQSEEPKHTIKTSIHSVNEILQELERNKEKIKPSCKEKCSGQENTLQEQFRKLLSNNSFNLDSEDFLDNLERLNLFLLDNKCKIALEQRQLFWNQFFVAYLHTCLSRADNEHKTEKIYDFITRSAPSYIADRVTALALNKASKSNFFYQTQCQALLFSFVRNNPNQVINDCEQHSYTSSL